MIDKTNAVQVLVRKLVGLPVGHAIDVRTYKRNRSVLFARTGEDAFLVLEDGFETHRFADVEAKKLKKLIKTLLKREFPRSNKMRVYELGAWDEAGYQPPARKKL